MQFTTRVLTADDYDAMISMSAGVYGGHDYLPFVFHDWILDPSRTIIGVCVGSTPIGLDTISLFDGGRSVMLQALRIHPEYRGFGLAKVLMGAVRSYIAEHLPNIDRYRVCVNCTNDVSLQMHLTKGFTEILHMPVSSFIVADECVHIHANPQEYVSAATVDQTISELLTFDSEKYGVEGIQTLDCDRRTQYYCHPLMPHGTIISNWMAYECCPQNLKFLARDHEFFISKEGSHLLAFSHACCSPRVLQVVWYVSIYTCDEQLLRAHLAIHHKRAKEKKCGAVYFFFPCKFSKDIEVILQGCPFDTGSDLQRPFTDTVILEKTGGL